MKTAVSFLFMFATLLPLAHADVHLTERRVINNSNGSRTFIMPYAFLDGKTYLLRNGWLMGSGTGFCIERLRNPNARAVPHTIQSRQAQLNAYIEYTIDGSISDIGEGYTSDEIDQAETYLYIYSVSCTIN